MISRARLLALCICFVSAACVSTVERSRWIRVRSANFEIVSGAGEERTREIAERLELLRAVLGRLGVRMTLEPAVPMLVYAFADSEAFARFRPNPGFVGFMLPRLDRYYLAIDASDPEAVHPIALHEYVHAVLRSGAARSYPQWYDEGLADFLSTIEIQDEHVVVGKVPPDRVHWLRAGSPLGMRHLMTAADVYSWPERTLARFYSQAWATTHFFQLGGRMGLPDRHAQMIRYLSLIDAGREPDEAVRVAFDADFDALEREFLRYLALDELLYFGLKRDALEVPDEITVAPVPEAEKCRLLGELALAAGEPMQGEAVTWFERALAADPRDARAHALLGRTLEAAGRDGSDAHLAQALALAPDDPVVQQAVADARFDRAVDSGDDRARLLAEAVRHYERSLALDPKRVPARAGLGRALLLDGELERGLEALRAAHEALPADRALAIELADAELAIGATARAKDLIARLPPPSHGDPVTQEDLEAVEQARARLGLPARSAPEQRHLETRLDVDRPLDGSRITGLAGWVEVMGRGGLWEAKHHDVILAIDESSSTLDPTGTDLDGDGKLGRLRKHRRYSLRASSDPDDTIIRAEIEAARVLLEQLDARTTRVALVTFSGGARLLAAFGTPAEALLALDAYEVHEDRTGTSLAAPMALAADLFFDNRDPTVRRQRAIYLLSDGQPTIPSTHAGRAAALGVAQQLGDVGVPVHAFALGEEALEEPEFYSSVATGSGGNFVPVEDPAKIVEVFAGVRFTGLREVSIESAPSGEPARSVRLFADGSFDGYVPLVPGENTITVTANIDEGGTIRESRTVYFEVPPEPGPEDVAAAEETERALEYRAIEFGLLEEIRRQRRVPQTRRLEVEIDESDLPPDP